MLLSILIPIMLQASAAQARVFDIFGMNTTSTYSGEFDVAGKKCKLKGNGVESCTRFAGTLIGNVGVIGLTTRFNNGHLISVSGSTVSGLFRSLDDSFTAKYGAPSRVENPDWQNQMGAKFDNVVKTWVFEDGELELRLRGSRIDSTEFIFVSRENLPEHTKPPVNF